MDHFVGNDLILEGVVMLCSFELHYIEKFINWYVLKSYINVVAFAAMNRKQCSKKGQKRCEYNKNMSGKQHNHAHTDEVK